VPIRGGAGHQLPRSHELGVIGAGHPRQLTAADQLLLAPGINALRAEIQVVRDLRDRPASFDKIQNLPPEFGPVTPGGQSSS
jgi:hypothetical protein